MINTGPIPEQEIIRRCLNGDSDQYAALVGRYKDLAFNIAFRILGDADLANDMAQDSFIAAYTHLKEFRRESKFSSWLCGILINRCKDHLRSAGKNVPFDESIDVLPSRARTPEQSVSARQSEEVLREALLRLPLEYREVIVLKHLEELDYREIAEILGISVGALKVRAYRGREMLRELLENRGVGV